MFLICYFKFSILSILTRDARKLNLPLMLRFHRSNPWWDDIISQCLSMRVFPLDWSIQRKRGSVDNLGRFDRVDHPGRSTDGCFLSTGRSMWVVGRLGRLDIDRWCFHSRATHLVRSTRMIFWSTQHWVDQLIDPCINIAASLPAFAFFCACLVVHRPNPFPQTWPMVGWYQLDFLDQVDRPKIGGFEFGAGVLFCWSHLPRSYMLAIPLCSEILLCFTLFNKKNKVFFQKMFPNFHLVVIA